MTFEKKIHRSVQAIRILREKITLMRKMDAEPVEIDIELMKLKQLTDDSRKKIGLDPIPKSEVDEMFKPTTVGDSLDMVNAIQYFPAVKPERESTARSPFVIVPDVDKAEKNITEIAKLVRKGVSGRTDLITKNCLQGKYL